MNHAKLTGLIAAPHTPMKPDGGIDLDGIERQARTLCAGGLSGVFVCGTTGEGLSLSVAERMAIAQRWIEVAAEELPVVVHVGSTSTADAKALAAHAQKIGARAIAAMGPCFLQPKDVRDLVPFCADIAAAAPALPFYYYHIPEVSGVRIAVRDLLEAAAGTIPTLVGAKFSHEDLMDYGRCLAMENGRFDMLFGRDEVLLCALVLGARGAVGTTYSYAAPLYLKILAAHEAGDLAAARACQSKAMEMVAVMKRHGGLPASKAMMRLVGLDCGPCRRPLRTLTDEQCRALRDDLERIGFFQYALTAR